MVSIKMRQYQKINVSEGIDVNKTSASEECELCHYWFFKDVGVKFEKHVCNGCHDLLMMAHSLKNIAKSSSKGATFRCVLMGYWFFKDVGFKFEKHVCHECHVLLTMAYSLKNIAISSAKGATFTCVLMVISKNEGLKTLNNSVIFDRGVL